MGAAARTISAGGRPSVCSGFLERSAAEPPLRLLASSPPMLGESLGCCSCAGSAGVSLGGCAPSRVWIQDPRSSCAPLGSSLFSFEEDTLLPKRAWREPFLAVLC